MVLSALGVEIEAVLFDSVVDVGKGDAVEDGERVGKREAFGRAVELTDVDGVRVEGVGKGIRPASAEGVAKKLVCLLTSLVMLAVAGGASGVDERLVPSSSPRTRVALVLLVLIAGLDSRAVAFPEGVAAEALVVPFEITPEAINPLPPVELALETPSTGPAANLAFNTTATATIPSADTNSNGTTALFSLRETRSVAGVSPGPTCGAVFSLRMVGAGAM